MLTGSRFKILFVSKAHEYVQAQFFLFPVYQAAEVRAMYPLADLLTIQSTAR